MSAPSCGCTPDPVADWEELGWCCPDCSLAAHLEWHREHDSEATP